MTETTSNFLLRTNRDYAIYVAETRAIPAIEDGLKHGQRMALWLLRNRSEKLKTVALSGLMSFERLFVHGQVSADNAIGLLAAPWKNNVPLIEGLGHFGSRAFPGEVGAPRYTEVRRAKAAELLLYRDLDLVPLEDNYDGSNKQPIHFLPLIPLVLLNGVEGIAVGWSTSILPRSLKNLVQATQDALSGKPLKTIPPHYENYDLRIVPREKNQWEFQGKAIIVDSSTIHITELPPGLGVEEFRKILILMEDEDQIMGFTDSSTKSIDIMIKMKRGSLKAEKWKESNVIDFFKLREKVTERITVIDWNRSRVWTYDGAEAVIEAFAQWRLAWYTKRFEKLLLDTNYELDYWLILKILFADGFTTRLGRFSDKPAMEAAVVAVASKNKLTLDDKQLDRVLSLPTYRWTKAFKDEVELKLDALAVDIKSFEEILTSPDRLKQVYLSELEEVKRKL